MLVSLFTSIIVALIFLLFSKFSFFKKDSSMPDVVVSWTDALIPVFLILLGAVGLYNAQMDVYSFITSLFSPVFNVAQTLPGILIVSFVVTLLYAFGISNWVLFPVIWAIWMQGIADNAALVQGRADAFQFKPDGVFPWFCLSGRGGCYAGTGHNDVIF